MNERRRLGSSFHGNHYVWMVGVWTLVSTVLAASVNKATGFRQRLSIYSLDNVNEALLSLYGYGDISAPHPKTFARIVRVTVIIVLLNESIQSDARRPRGRYIDSKTLIFLLQSGGCSGPSF